MSYIVTPFEVSSKALLESFQVRFVHLLSGISIRHSDTVDCVFLVNGQKVIVAISLEAVTTLREREKRSLTDQQLAEITSLFLRRTLEAGYDPTQAELRVGDRELRALAGELGYL